MLARSADPVYEKKIGLFAFAVPSRVHEKVYEKVREKVHEKVHENCMKKKPGIFKRLWLILKRVI